MKDMYPNQKIVSTKEGLIMLIGEAGTIRKLNELRLEVVKAKNKPILEMWQKKFWELREKL